MTLNFENITLNKTEHKLEYILSKYSWTDADFFRYIDPVGFYSKPHLLLFKIVKETPKGYWIKEIDFDESIFEMKKKWISKSGIVKFAYSTREQALYSYYRRKLAQIKILESRLDNTKNIVHILTKLYKVDKKRKSKNGFFIESEEMKL